MLALVLTFLSLLGGSGELRVSFQRGNDATGDGSVQAPFRTLTRALGAARSREVRRIQLEYGTYDEGESFPLVIPPGLEVRGIGAGGTVLSAIDGTLLVVNAPGSAETAVVAELALTGADVGLKVSAARLALRGVRFEDLGVGVHAMTGAEPLTVIGNGLRAVECGVGLDAEGEGILTLILGGSSFERCEVGLLLRAAEDVEIGAYDGPGVNHRVVLEGCVFQGCERAGFERRGSTGANLGDPYEFSNCLFQGNRVGIELMRPSADTPIRVRGSRFFSNVNFGMRVAGNAGDPTETSLIDDSEFRWNGVGLHMTNSHVVFEVRRSRFLDNVGNALFLANFQTEPLSARVISSLIAGNGGAGVYTMADGQKLGVEILHSTIAHNGAGGVHRTTRHSGESRLEIKGCVVVGNAPDLVKIEREEVSASLVGDGGGGSERGNLSGDPGFRNAALRDYRLASGSRCIDAGEADPRLGELDLAGLVRAEGAPDLGAFENSKEH